MAEVKFNSQGFIQVPVFIKPKDSLKLAYLNYKVDTGANLTTISSEKLRDLGYSKDWIKSGRLLEGDERPRLASGKYLNGCYEIVLPEICIGDWVGYNWPFITNFNITFNLLLGTNSLQFFNWNLDYGHGICKFELIPGKRKLVFGQKEQSIHALDELQDM